MNVPANSYWSVDDCAWVSSPVRAAATRPGAVVPKPAEAPEAVLDLTDDAGAEVEEPLGAPV